MVFRILATTLCLSLVVPSGSAMEQTGTSAARGGDDGLKRAPETSLSPDITGPNSPQPLSEEEAQALSERAEEPGPEVAGGALSGQHLTYIVIALAAAVFVLIFK